MRLRWRDKEKKKINKWGKKGTLREENLCTLLCTFLQSSREVSSPEKWSLSFLGVPAVRKDCESPLETRVILLVLIYRWDVNMCLLPLTVATWRQLSIVVQAMLEEPLGYSMLYDSILVFGLLFLESLWVWNTQRYLEAILVKLEAEVFQNYEMQALLPSAYAFWLNFTTSAPSNAVLGLHLGSTRMIEQRSILCKRCFHWMDFIARQWGFPFWASNWRPVIC